MKDIRDMTREELINTAVKVATADMENIGVDTCEAYQEASEADPLDLIAYIEGFDPEQLESILLD